MNRFLATLVVLVFAPAALVAGPRYEDMDYGPFLSATYQTPGENITLKGVAVKLRVHLDNQLKDEGPIGDGLYSNRPRNDIAGTSEQEIYKTQRWKFNGYRLNAPPGSYKVTLKFSDSWSPGKGKRVFDVLLQGAKVVDKLDIVDRVGKDKALDLTFDARVDDQHDQIVIEFVRHAGEPSLNALVIEGDDYTRKINCGGPAHEEYAGDWKSGHSAAQNELAGAIFDTELLRYSSGWSGGFLQLRGVVFDGGHGVNPGTTGETLLSNRSSPGWGKDGSFADPRAVPYGPLPDDWGKYHGLFRNGDNVVFSYSVGDCDILDMPGCELVGSERVITRTLNLGPSSKPMWLAVCDVPGASGRILADDDVAVLEALPQVTAAYAVGAPDGAAWEIHESERMVLKLPPRAEPTRLKIVVWNGPQPRLTATAALLHNSPTAVDLSKLTSGGPPRWTTPVETKGVRAADDAAYVVDQLTVPEDNPWRSWMRPSGFDFFADGRAALCTWSGDVWIVSGIDGRLEKLRWRRFATGLFQPLGLKIVEGKIYVLGRDQITLVEDLNNDGEADSYKNFNNDCMVTPNFHEFAFDLQTDADGAFYYLKAGPIRPGGRGWDKITSHHGCLLKVAKDGSKLEVVARGFRAPNGLAIGPRGEMTTGDNEGTWVPTTPINWVTPGGFYGVPDFAARNASPSARDNPLCWIPHSIDNSAGSQVWITGKKFGPLSDGLVHMSYGQCTLLRVLSEQVDGQMQGGVFVLPLKFESGIMRGRFRESDNGLYLAGMRGWQTTATRDSGFYRVRYTGKPITLPTSLRVMRDGIAIGFSQPLDKSTAEDDSNYSIEQWNYQTTENLGSKHFRASDPKKEGQDELDVETATLSADRKTILLKIEGLKPVMQMRIGIAITAADGANVKYDIYNTINAVGSPTDPEVSAVEPPVVERKR